MIQEVIRKYNNLETTYGSGLTNHLNMALFALYKLGAKTSSLHYFATTYIESNQIKHHKEPEVAIDEMNWPKLWPILQMLIRRLNYRMVYCQ